MKKFIKLLFSITLLIIVCFTNESYVYGYNITEGNITDINGTNTGLYYTIDNNGTMYITGKGGGASYRPFGLNFDYRRPWDNYKDDIIRVIFDCNIDCGTIFSIGDGGSLSGWFAGCSNLLEVNGIPDGITDMSATFYGCEKLNRVSNLPEGIVTMQYTFAECRSLTESPILPSSIADGIISEYEGYDLMISEGLLCTYMGCANLVTCPDIPKNHKLKRLNGTFMGCNRLENMKEIPENITEFINTFKDCYSIQPMICINAGEAEFYGEVFKNCSINNDYITFIKCANEKVGNKVLKIIDNSSRVYLWNGAYTINFKVLNTVNDSLYNLKPRVINLRYGANYANQIIGGCRYYFNSLGYVYDREYKNEEILPDIDIPGFVFAGWYEDSEYNIRVDVEKLLKPSNNELASHSKTLYAKLNYIKEDCRLIINSNGGYYKGSNSIITVENFDNYYFEDRFEYTGDYSSYITRLNGEYHFTLYGAQGGASHGFTGGYGAMISGFAKLPSNTRLYINVGGGGEKYNKVYSAGGYNGGGDSVGALIYTDEDDVDYYTNCGGGGGATDIRINSNDMANRIITAGGGGGAGLHNIWYCQDENPEEPNIYYDDDDDPYYKYERTIASPVGQGGLSCAGGGGGIRGGAHNYTGIEEHGRLNSSYGGTSGADLNYVIVKESKYHVWGLEEQEENGINGCAIITYVGKAYEIEEPVKEGYIFTGWTIEGDGIIREGKIFMNTGTTVITANYQPIDYYITFDANGGTANKTSIKVWQNFEVGLFEKMPEAYKEGCIFTGWYTQKTGGEKISEADLFLFKGNLTLYAHYEFNTIQVYLDADGGIIDGSEILTVRPYANYGKIIEPTKAGYVFAGWFNEMGQVFEDTTVTLLKPHKLVAKWLLLTSPDIEYEYQEGDWHREPITMDFNIYSGDNTYLTGFSLVKIDNNTETVIYEKKYREGVTSDYFEYIIGDKNTKECEGITKWLVYVYNSGGLSSISEFETKLDFTPPVIGALWQYNTKAIEYQISDVIRQRAYDTVSGVTRFEITPTQLQKNYINTVITPRILAEPFEIAYDTKKYVSKNNGAYILKAYDRAGNVAYKLIFTKRSVNNAILRKVL